jgi:uncharacterized protein
MSVVVVADTHMPRGRRRLPGGCLDALREAEAIVHAGDFFALETLELFRSFRVPLIAVHGNVDNVEVRRRLPAEASFELGGHSVAVVHDAGPKAGRSGRLRRRFPEAAAVIFGHSHLPLHERDPGGFQIFNPGSPTERRRAPAHTIGLLDLSPQGELRFHHHEV